MIQKPSSIFLHQTLEFFADFKINSAKYELLIGEEIYLRKIRGLEYFILHIVNVIDNFKVVQKFYDIRPISRVLSSY